METEHATNPAPTVEQLIDWESEGGCEATDGCSVEPDGICEHGCKSWLLVMGMIQMYWQNLQEKKFQHLQYFQMQKYVLRNHNQCR